MSPTAAPASDVPAAHVPSPVRAVVGDGPSGELLYFGGTEDTARRIESALRNAGHPLRVDHATDAPGLKAWLAREVADLVLAEQEPPTVPLDELVGRVRAHGPLRPVLALARHGGVAASLAALRQGAADAVGDDSAEALEHLTRVVVREFINARRLKGADDVSARLDAFETRHRQMLDRATDAVAYLREGFFIGANAALAGLLGVADAAALNGRSFLEVVAETDQPRVRDTLRRALRGRAADEPLEIDLLNAEGQPRPVTARLVQSQQDNETQLEVLVQPRRGPAIGEATLGNTLSETPAGPRGRTDLLHELTARLAAVAPSADPEASPPPGVAAALLVVVDQFAAHEERLGMTEAELAVTQLTRALAERLPAETEPQVFAFSPHEIAVLLRCADGTALEALANDLQAGLSAQELVLSKREARLPVTVGVYPLGVGDDAQQVVQELARRTREASGRLLDARGESPPKVLVLGQTAASDKAARADARLAAMIRKAIPGQQFRLAYQNIASLEGDPREHYDVLLRMPDEHGQEMMAGDFLPVAERFGLMPEIDRWVVRRVIRSIHQRRGSDERCFFVRLSEASVRDAASFWPWFAEQLNSFPIRPGELILLLHEEVVHNQIRKSRGLFERARASGCGTAVDRFGLSASSVNLLEQIPLTHLKLDAEFTRNFNDRDVAARMHRIMDVARQKHIKTIVSHVEDANVMARLWQMGINYIQGFHIQEPESVMLMADVTLYA